jgi:hypothetical protein
VTRLLAVTPSRENGRSAETDELKTLSGSNLACILLDGVLIGKYVPAKNQTSALEISQIHSIGANKPRRPPVPPWSPSSSSESRSTPWGNEMGRPSLSQRAFVVWSCLSRKRFCRSYLWSQSSPVLSVALQPCLHLQRFTSSQPHRPALLHIAGHDAFTRYSFSVAPSQLRHSAVHCRLMV